MMNKQIRRMIDEIFADMKMTADNLALRDELMANAQARFEDSVRADKTEEEAFAEVAASLGDVQSLLREMNEKPEETAAQADETAKAEPDAPKDEEAEADEGKAEEPDFEVKTEKTPDIGEALGKAFGALGDVGKQIVPQAQKLVKQVDDLTGGVIGGIGKAVGKGLSDAQKAAGKAIDRLSGDKGEIVIDFGEEKPKAPAALRERAKTIRAEAELKQAAGDQEGARELRAKAYALETEADEVEKKLAELAEKEKAEKAAQAEREDTTSDDEFDALQREMDAMQEALKADAVEVEADAGCPSEPIDLDDVVRDAEDAARQAEPFSGAPGVVVISRYPAAGLREVNVSLDSDDVTVKAADGTDVVVEWEAGREGVEQPTVTLEEHTLSVRRANPDVFKTFFSVFQKEGGKVTVRVPRGYAADYVLGTTSGDIRLYAIDVDKVKVNTTSGDVRVEPDAGIRAKEIDVTTISGGATVSACAGDVVVSTVSGRQFVSCDANRADLSVVSGKVHAEGASEEWEINSVSGDVEVLCTVAPTRKVQVNSMSANVHVALPGDIRGFVADISSMSGKIVNEFGPNRYGTCALPIHMDTMSGKLMITRL